MFRSCRIIIRELCSLLKVCYSIHNSIRICKRGVVAAYTSIHSVWCEEKRFELVNIGSRKIDVIVLANGSCTFRLPLFATYKQIL